MKARLRCTTDRRRFMDKYRVYRIVTPPCTRIDMKRAAERQSPAKGVPMPALFSREQLEPVPMPPVDFKTARGGGRRKGVRATGRLMEKVLHADMRLPLSKCKAPWRERPLFRSAAWTDACDRRNVYPKKPRGVEAGRVFLICRFALFRFARLLQNEHEERCGEKTLYTFLFI